jgi:hypothetical protein
MVTTLDSSIVLLFPLLRYIVYYGGKALAANIKCVGRLNIWFSSETPSPVVMVLSNN